jgi:quercetin dioxygenase-like cupin family protein
MTTTANPTTRPAYWFLGGRMTILLDGAETGGRTAVVRQELPPALATPLHVQPGDDETFLVLEGEIELWVEGETHRAGAGEAVSVARGTRHAFRVTSPEGALVISFGAPAGHERFFALGGEPAGAEAEPPAAPLDMERMGAAAAAAGVELLGPPPFAA